MKRSFVLAGARVVSVLVVLFVGIGLLPARAPAAAAVAISGSFYTQKFEIPAGGSASGPSIYVTAFNRSTEAATFVVGYSAPPDVTLVLSDNVFSLNPAESREVLVAVHVGVDAVPGLHDITVSVRAQKDTTEGIQVLGAAEQVATLSIVGEAGSVHAEAVSPRGDRVLAQVRLWKIIGGEQYEIASSHTGVIDTIVSPGSYVVKAYSMGVELDSEEFQIAHLEQKNITLSAETIYFKYFSATLAKNINTGAPGYVQVLYTIANVYQPVDDAAVNLTVTFNGEYLEAMPGILTLSALNTGDTGVPYQYFPGPGWQTGTYGFTVDLYIGGQPYASTQETTLDVEVVGGRSSSWLWIIFVILGVIGAAGLGLAATMWLKRRGAQERPRKEKKRKEAKPARKPEPVAQPEPAQAAKTALTPKPAPAPPAKPVQQPQPVQAAKPAPPPTPVQSPKPIQAARPAPSPAPVQQAQPAQQARPVQAPQPVQQARPAPLVQPARAQQAPKPAPPARQPAPPARALEQPPERQAPLAAVSSLKARMASLGQDQRLGRDTDEDEEEAEVEAQDAVPEEPVQEGVEVTVVADEVSPAELEPEPVAVESESDMVSSVTVTSEAPPPAPEETVAPEETAPAEEAVPVSEAALFEEAAPAEDVPVAAEVAASDEVATEGPETEAETAPQPPLMKSSFVEAAKLRMQAREHASVDSGGKDEG